MPLTDPREDPVETLSMTTALPPGPSAPRLVQLLRWLRRPIEMFEECARRYGGTFTMRLPGSPPLVLVSEPEAVRQVFSGSVEVMHAGASNVILRPFLGESSLFLLDGAAHVRHRRLILPALHGEQIHAHGAEMLRLTHAAIEAWPVGEPFPLHPTFQQITLGVILRSIFGLAEDARSARLAKLMLQVLRLATWPPMLIPALQKDLGRWSPWGRLVRIRAEIDANLFEEIAARRRGAGGRADVLSMLVAARDEAGEPLSDPELRDELLTFMAAGHETTATSLAWAMRWILATPEVAAQLREEIATATAGGALVPELVAKLPLLDAAAREALRLSPVIPMVSRLLQQPTRIGGYDLPAGVRVAPLIHVAHRRPEAFPEPARFHPARFLDGKVSAYEWFPFGGGARRCIGMAFAMYEMKLILAAVLHRAELELVPGQTILPRRRSITIAPSGGVKVTVRAKHAEGPRARG